MAVDAIIQQVAAIAAAIPGIIKAWDKAPESLNELPAAVAVPSTGAIQYPRVPGLRQSEHVIKLILFFSRGDLPTADAQARPFIDQVVRTFDQHLTLGGSVAASGITDYKYGKVSWAGVDYLGVEFSLRAVEREVGNYAP